MSLYKFYQNRWMEVFSYELGPETCAIVIFMCELVYISNKKKGVKDASSPKFINKGRVRTIGWTIERE